MPCHLVNLHIKSSPESLCRVYVFEYCLNIVLSKYHQVHEQAMSVASKFYTPISNCSFHTEMPLPQGSPRPAWPHLRPHRTLKSALRLRKYTFTGMIIYVHRKQNISTTESDEKFHAVMRSISLVCDCLQPQMQQSTLTFGPPKSGPPKILGHIRVHVLASPERIVMKTQPWDLGGSWRKVGHQFQNGEQQL